MKRIFSLFFVIVLMLVAIPTFCVSASGKAQFTVGKVTGAAGEEVTVPVSITANPGLCTVMVQIGYDANVLEVVKITPLMLGGAVTTNGPPTANPLKVTWSNPLLDTTDTGDIATITFKIKGDAVDGIYTLTATSKQEDVFDTKFNDVPFETVNGYINIKNPNTPKPQDTSSQESAPSQQNSSEVVSSEKEQTSSNVQVQDGTHSSHATQTDNSSHSSSEVNISSDSVSIEYPTLDENSNDIISTDSTDSPQDNNSHNGWLLWVVIAAIVVLGSAFAVVIIKSKKQ